MALEKFLPHDEMYLLRYGFFLLLQRRSDMGGRIDFVVEEITIVEKFDK